MASVSHDRNLLFGVFAVQLQRVTSAQLMEVAGAWATDPSRGLPERLEAAGYLTPKDRALLDDIVERAVADNAGDATATLAEFGGDIAVYQTYRGSVTRSASGGVHSTMPAGRDMLTISSDSVPAVYETPGRYSMLGEYSHGGMGRILLVHDGHIGRDVALKELLPQNTGVDSGMGKTTPVQMSMPLVARFLQEARITGQLEHPSIVPVYELGHRRDGTLYYTMKLVRGRTLQQELATAGTLEARLALLPNFLSLCQAIAYAHSRGVIHRDIKPGNVMVGEFGETVVIDWGLSKVREREDVHANHLAETVQMMQLDAEVRAKTEHGAILGTPQYMPPEQACGDLSQVDERSDIYSLGVVLYEILTHKTPYKGRTIGEVLELIMNSAPPPVREVERAAPPELAAICERAMQRDPAARYQSARELAEDIQRFMRGGLVRSYRYGFVERASRFYTRNRRAIGFAALLLLVAYGLFSVYDLFVTRQQAKLQGTRAIAAVQEELAAALLFRDKTTAQTTLAVVTAEPEIRAARLFDPEGTPFVTQPPGAEETVPGLEVVPASRFTFLGDVLLFAEPLALQGAPRGTAVVVIRTGDITLREEATARTWAVIGVVLAGGLIWRGLAHWRRRKRSRSG